MSSDKNTAITIPEQIDQDYRKYALYVIQSRGIPNFYDCLTPVQRLILQKQDNKPILINLIPFKIEERNK